MQARNLFLPDFEPVEAVAARLEVKLNLRQALALAGARSRVQPWRTEKMKQLVVTPSQRRALASCDCLDEAWFEANPGSVARKRIADPVEARLFLGPKWERQIEQFAEFPDQECQAMTAITFSAWDPASGQIGKIVCVDYSLGGTDDELCLQFQRIMQIRGQTKSAPFQAMGSTHFYM